MKPLKNLFLAVTSLAILTSIASAAPKKPLIEAAAATYPPTKAGLEQLVAHDVALLPQADAQRLETKLHDWQKGIGVQCYGQGKSRSCYPDAKDIIAQIQAHIFSFDGNVVDDRKWSRVNKPLSQAVDPTDFFSSSDVKLERNIPQIVNPGTPQARAFNEAAERFVDHVFVAAGSWGQESAALPTLSDYVHSDRDEDDSVDYAVDPEPVAGFVSISINWTTYPHGAAHAFFDSEAFNWNFQKQRPVLVGDIFDLKADWKRGVATAIIEANQNGTAGTLPDSKVSALESLIGGPKQWAITKSGLQITFNQSVNSYTTRGPVVSVAWHALCPYLNRDSPITHDFCPTPHQKIE